MSTEVRNTPISWVGSEWYQGSKDALPVLTALFPFSVIFGAIAIESGLSFGELLLTSMSIYAVASQYLMLDLMGQEVPIWLIVTSVFALSFRHVLYSAAIGRKLTAFSPVQKALAFFVLIDPQYAIAEARASYKKITPAYYFSYAATVYVTWIVANCVGAMFGDIISQPEIFGLDFILPLYFMALIMGFRRSTGFLPIACASSAASLLSYYTVGSPWHISIGGFVGLIVAAAMCKPKGAVND